MKLKLFFSFFFLLIILSGCTTTKISEKYDTFAKCLTAKEATIYGTNWCPHCKSQKEMFGDSFQYINYVDCDKDKSACFKAVVEGYPTWKINGDNYPGEQSLEKLASLTGCELIEDSKEVSEVCDTEEVLCKI
jgi:glutaredoxin